MIVSLRKSIKLKDKQFGFCSLSIQDKIIVPQIINKFENRKRFGIWVDMGLGKTVQIITLLKANIINKPSLIVCPKTLIFNWKSEFLKFDGETKVVEIYGTSSKREELINSIDYNENAVYITSYESLRSDIDLYKKEFKYFILDEAQVIKNVYTSSQLSIDTSNT